MARRSKRTKDLKTLSVRMVGIVQMEKWKDVVLAVKTLIVINISDNQPKEATLTYNYF